jgi:hypothetical protein
LQTRTSHSHTLLQHHRHTRNFFTQVSPATLCACIFAVHFPCILYSLFSIYSLTFSHSHTHTLSRPKRVNLSLSARPSSTLHSFYPLHVHIYILTYTSTYLHTSIQPGAVILLLILLTLLLTLGLSTHNHFFHNHTSILA